MKKISKIVFLLSLFAVKSYAYDKRPWVYVDLGDTIVNTSDMKHIKYMKGAREYILELKLEGFNVGIISNIPEEWGLTYEEKLNRLKQVIASGWDEELAFDWSVYDEIILPLKNNEMKPAPTLFLKAILKADSCPSLYIGESPKEIKAAIEIGMAAKLFEPDLDDSLISPVELRGFIAENYKLPYDTNCL